MVALELACGRAMVALELACGRAMVALELACGRAGALGCKIGVDNLPLG
jgi:hypothetical protein